MRKIAHKKHKSNGQFIKLPHSIVESDAWKDCPASARLVYIAVIWAYNGTNNGSIPLSCRQAAKFAKVTPNTAATALRMLELVGLIECTQKTTFQNGKRLARQYALTHLPVGNKVATQKYKSWKSKGSNLRDMI